MGYEFLEHVGDVKFCASGYGVGDMFISASGALNETIRGNIEIAEVDERTFEVTGRDMHELLYNFLEEFLVLLEGEDFLVARVKSIEVVDLKIKCVVVGDSVDDYVFTNDVKAVTYSEMKVSDENGLWKCEVVLDV
jgi:SHS2 domain-containing protein